MKKAVVAVIWQAADRVAVRPELTFLRGSSSDTSTSPLTGISATPGSDSSSIGVGISGLFYLHRWDALRTYVSPRFAYARNTSSPSSASSFSTTDLVSRSYGTSGAFGAQYTLGRHFGVFGEIGLAYSSTTTTVTSTVTIQVIGLPGAPAAPSPIVNRSEVRGTSFGTRSGAGVILYF